MSTPTIGKIHIKLKSGEAVESNLAFYDSRPDIDNNGNELIYLDEKMHIEMVKWNTVKEVLIKFP